MKCDIADAASVKKVMAEMKSSGLPAVRGAMHLAAVLDDATLPNLTRENLQKAFGAKVQGAQNLHDALDAKSLDWLILFSSTSALVGSPGQANYSAANSALDALAFYWQQQGEKVWSVQWGPWAEAGMAAQQGTVKRLRAQGVGSLSNAFGMSCLSSVINSSSSMLVAQPTRWSKYLQQSAQVPPFLTRFRGANANRNVDRSAQDLSPEGVLAFVRSVAAESTGMAISDDTILTESGMDSLSAVEFRNRLVAEYGVKLNERSAGVPLLLIPGALQTVDAFKPLASMVPVPVMGWDWPVAAQESLAVVATEAVRQLRDLRPTGPYRLGGHSIGGVLAAEMARQLEAAGETVEAVVLLDTRTLPPFVPLTPPEGVTIPSQLTWQLQCLADHPALATVAAPVLLFRAQDLSTVGPLEGFLGSAFQDDEEVARRLAKVAATVRTRTVAGRHFSLYAEPQVGELALQLCGQLAAL